MLALAFLLLYIVRAAVAKWPQEPDNIPDVNNRPFNPNVFEDPALAAITQVPLNELTIMPGHKLAADVSLVYYKSAQKPATKTSPVDKPTKALVDIKSKPEPSKNVFFITKMDSMPTFVEIPNNIKAMSDISDFAKITPVEKVLPLPKTMSDKSVFIIHSVVPSATPTLHLKPEFRVSSTQLLTVSPRMDIDGLSSASSTIVKVKPGQACPPGAICRTYVPVLTTLLTATLPVHKRAKKVYPGLTKADSRVLSTVTVTQGELCPTGVICEFIVNSAVIQVFPDSLLPASAHSSMFTTLVGAGVDSVLASLSMSESTNKWPFGTWSSKSPAGILESATETGAQSTSSSLLISFSTEPRQVTSSTSSHLPSVSHLPFVSPASLIPSSSIIPGSLISSSPLSAQSSSSPLSAQSSSSPLSAQSSSSISTDSDPGPSTTIVNTDADINVDLVASQNTIDKRSAGEMDESAAVGLNTGNPLETKSKRRRLSPSKTISLNSSPILAGSVMGKEREHNRFNAIYQGYGYEADHGHDLSYYVDVKTDIYHYHIETNYRPVNIHHHHNDGGYGNGGWDHGHDDGYGQDSWNGHGETTQYYHTDHGAYDHNTGYGNNPSYPTAYNPYYNPNYNPYYPAWNNPYYNPYYSAGYNPAYPGAYGQNHPTAYPEVHPTEYPTAHITAYPVTYTSAYPATYTSAYPVVNPVPIEPYSGSIYNPYYNPWINYNPGYGISQYGANGPYGGYGENGQYGSNGPYRPSASHRPHKHKPHISDQYNPTAHGTERRSQTKIESQEPESTYREEYEGDQRNYTEEECESSKCDSGSCKPEKCESGPCTEEFAYKRFANHKIKTAEGKVTYRYGGN